MAITCLLLNKPFIRQALADVWYISTLALPCKQSYSSNVSAFVVCPLSSVMKDEFAESRKFWNNCVMFNGSFKLYNSETAHFVSLIVRRQKIVLLILSMLQFWIDKKIKSLILKSKTQASVKLLWNRMVEIRYAKADISRFCCHVKTADARATKLNESFGFPATLHHKLHSHKCKRAC